MGAFEEKIGLVNTKEGGWEMTKEPLGSGGGCEGDSGSHPVGVLVFLPPPSSIFFPYVCCRGEGEREVRWESWNWMWTVFLYPMEE